MIRHFWDRSSCLTSHYWRSRTGERRPWLRSPSRDERAKLWWNQIGPRSCWQGGFVSKFRFLIRISFRFFAALLGLGLLGYLVFRIGPGVVWKQVQVVGWGFSLIIILGGLSQLIRTCAWRQTITYDIKGLH